MFQSTDFIFDGKRGSDYGIFMVYVGDSGLVEQSFGIKRKSVSERIKNRHKSYSYAFETEVLEMNLKFSKESAWTYEDKVEFKRWFIQDGFRVFSCDDFPIEFDVACVGEPKFYMDATGKGYFNVQFESNSDCGYSPTSIAEYDLSDNTSEGTILSIYNKSNTPDLYYKPEIEVTLTGTATGFSFYNLNDGNREFTFTGLTAGETIYINSQTEKIYSVLSETRYSNLKDGKFFRMVFGLNRIKIIGTCTVRFRYRFPMMV
jgi:hypothetical protein